VSCGCPEYVDLGRRRSLCRPPEHAANAAVRTMLTRRVAGAATSSGAAALPAAANGKCRRTRDGQCPTSRSFTVASPVPTCCAVHFGISRAYLARLIQQLRGIFTQAARQLAQLLGRRPPLTQQPLELRQAVPVNDRKSWRLSPISLSIWSVAVARLSATTWTRFREATTSGPA